MSDAFAEQVKMLVRKELRKVQFPVQQQQQQVHSYMAWHWGICNVAIAAATDGATGSSTGEVEILKRDTTTDYLERTGITHDITHRFEGIDLEKDMLVIIARLKGEWVVMAADCDAMASPPS